MNTDLKPDGHLPDLRTPDHNGHPRTLRELAAGDPRVVNLHRGWWCPEEQAFFRRPTALQAQVDVTVEEGPRPRPPGAAGPPSTNFLARGVLRHRPAAIE